MAEKKNINKGSKKSKRSWRKKTDIADVEEHLEEVRFEERTGGPVSDKPDEDLFYVEKKVNIGEKVNRKKGKVGIEVDDDDDEVYIPKKNRLKQKLIDDAVDESKRRKVELRKAQAKSIWGQDVMTVTDAFLDSTVKRKKVKPRTVGTGKSNIEAVIIADAGASYNPDFESHQELLSKAHVAELRKIKEREKYNKKVHMVSVEQLKKQSTLWLKEMSEGISQTAGSNKVIESEDEEGDGGTISNPVSADNRKTRKQRRRKLLLKQLERQKLELKHEKAKLNDILRLKSLKREIHRMSNNSMISQKRKIKDTSMATKRLSKNKFVEPEVAVHLSEELSGSLRKFKPEGNLLVDRFKSFQRRNIIEARNPVIPHRRYKRKVFVRRSYKTHTIKDFNPSK